MKRTAGIFVALLLLAVNAHAQWNDTLHRVMHGTVYPDASFDSRNSFVSSQKAHIWGVKLGVDFSGYLQLGIGFNRHDNYLRKDIHFINAEGRPDIASGKLHLAYISYYLRYSYYKTEHWRFGIMPAQVGIGISKYVYNDGAVEKITDKRWILLWEPGISVIYKPLKWIGVGTDIGYRFMIKNNPAIPENFNSLTYSFYVSVYWGEVYKLCFPDSKFAKML